MAATDDLPPPLEDMTEVLEKAEKLRNIRLQEAETSCAKNKEDSLKEKTCEIVKPSQNVQQDVIKSNGSHNPTKDNKTFGGMKKGFLFGGSSKKSHSIKDHMQTNSSSKHTDVPFITKKETENKFAFNEVQDAMKANENLLQNQEWVTDGLLDSIAKNPTLANRLQDPTFMRALQEFQTNPAIAAEKYKNNAEIQKVFQEFCGIMGEHFSRFSDQKDSSAKPQNLQQVKDIQIKQGNGVDMSIRSSTNPNVATAEDDRKMQEILSNPEVREVLMDPWIQTLIATLKNDPSKGQRMLQGIDVGKQRKLRKLTEVGLLQLQTF